MTANRRPQPTSDNGELRLWKVGRTLTATFVAAVLVACGVFRGLAYLLDFQEIDTTKKLDAKTLFDLVELPFGVVAGAGALVAYRRQRVDDAGARREATRLHTGCFSQAVEQLGSTLRPSNLAASTPWPDSLMTPLTTACARPPLTSCAPTSSSPSLPTPARTPPSKKKTTATWLPRMS
ncbi:hypothetical protein ACWDQ0_30895 [Streptomyces sp. NPDC003642]